MKSSDHFVIFLFTFPFAFEREQEYPDALTLTSFGRGRLTSFGQDGPQRGALQGKAKR